MHYRPMFGFHDHSNDRRSGRPQAHYSWVAETITTWAAWVSATTSLVGAVAWYLRWGSLDGPTQMALASVLFAAIGYWRHTMLVRKRAAFRDAVADYEAALAKPFD
jgi:hypothetical protein